MGGPSAPGEIGPGAETQAWLATTDDRRALRSGRHFYHCELSATHPAVSDHVLQDGLLAACASLTGRERGPVAPLESEA